MMQVCIKAGRGQTGYRPKLANKIEKNWLDRDAPNEAANCVAQWTSTLFFRNSFACHALARVAWRGPVNPCQRPGRRRWNLEVLRR
jgi:hypothetical protein